MSSGRHTVPARPLGRGPARLGLTDPEARLDSLIEAAHEAALDPRLWQDFGPRLAAAFGANSAALHVRDDALGAPRALTFTANYADADVAAYERDYAREDLWVQRGARLEPGHVRTSEELATLREMERTAWYTDWCVPFDVRHLVGAALPVAADALCLIGVHRAARLGPFGTPKTRLMAGFLPHLRRALQVRQRLASLDLDHRMSLESARRSGTMAIVVSAEGRILSLTPGAEQLLTSGQRGLIAVAGRLTASAPDAAERLRSLVAQAAETAASRGRVPGGTLCIGRGEDQAPVSVLVAPFRLAREGAKASPAAAIVFLRCAEPALLSVPALRQL